MGFHYPLQKIVDLKVNERTQAEWILSEAFGVFNKLKNSAQQLQYERDQWAEKISEKTSNATSIAEVQLMHRHLDYLDEQIFKTTEELDEASAQVETCRKSLGKKMMTEKMWQNAKNKAFEDYKLEMQRLEQQSVDELVNARFNHQLEAR